MAQRPSPPDRAIAVTLGDPRGVGPEVARRAVAVHAREAPETSLVVLSPPSLAKPFLELPGSVRVHPVTEWDGTDACAGHVAVACLEEAVRLALEEEVGGIVTGPVHKPSLYRAGWRVPGQTEMLQELAGVRDVGMLMCAERTELGGALRVLLATTHLALRDVPRAVTASTLVRQTVLLHRALRELWRIGRPRIALCALNPHASDEGLFGDEEARVFVPAVSTLGSEGVNVLGPIPADTVFRRAISGEFDAVVAPYHDVGMAAFKTAAFGTGVNVTLGLPFIRTSPDHGTAFDVARTPGRVDATSMLEALRLAATLCHNRFDTESRDV